MDYYIAFFIPMASSQKPLLPGSGTRWIIRITLSICSHTVILEFHFLILIHASMARPRTPGRDGVMRFPWTPFTLGYLLFLDTLFFLGYFASLAYTIWRPRDGALTLPKGDDIYVDGHENAA